MELVNINRENFDYQEFFASNTADRLGIDNLGEFKKELHYKTYINNLVNLSYQLQKLRDLLNCQEFYDLSKLDNVFIKINSGYRCPALNKAVGGRANSQHMKGEAVDFNINNIRDIKFLKTIAKYIKSKNFQVDQLLVENTWIHFSCKLQENRNMFGTYINGKFVSF